METLYTVKNKKLRIGDMESMIGDASPAQVTAFKTCDLLVN